MKRHCVLWVGDDWVGADRSGLIVSGHVDEVFLR